MQAYCLIREQPWYRREAFIEGLRAFGAHVCTTRPSVFNADTVLLIWNRYGDYHALACEVERHGGTVLVAENGYLGPGGSVPKWDVHPHGPRPGDYYALAVGGHNGSGWTPTGGLERWQRLGIELKPMRTDGDYQLVCPSRGFGRPDLIPPSNWQDRIVKRLYAEGYRVLIRNHPGNDKPKRPLAVDLEGASAVHIWASTAGLHALIAGVPVACYAPYWIGGVPTPDGWNDCEWYDDDARDEMARRVSWAQWTVEEIASGLPFRYLLCGTSTPAATLTA